MPRERYVIRAGELVLVASDFRPTPRGNDGRGVQIVPDIEPYTSPIDDAVVGGRRQKREDLKRHGCREYEPTERAYVAKRQDAELTGFVDRIFRPLED